MAITPKNVRQHELIGLEAEVAASTDPSCVGVKGRIVDETKQTLSILSLDGKERRLIKKCCTFNIYLSSGPVRIEGCEIAYRPEDRIKKVRRK